MNDFHDLEIRMDRLEQYARSRIALDQKRSSADEAIRVASVGDVNRVWLTSGVVSDGGTKTVYLTWNGQAGGDSMFSALPDVRVYRNTTASEGLVSGAEPTSPTLATNWREHADFVVGWVPGNEVYRVTVENNEGDGGSYDFAILANGV